MIHVKRKTLIIHIKDGDLGITEAESKINSKMKANEFVSVFNCFSRKMRFFLTWKIKQYF